MATATEASRRTDVRRNRVVEICTSLPEVEVSGDPHLSFKVHKKILAYYLCNHHGDGRIAVWCKAPPGEQSRLIEENPRRFFVPPYVGHRGWVGIRVDLPSVNWAELRYLVQTAYRLTAPRRLAARLE
jgi:hypothetical protein